MKDTGLKRVDGTINTKSRTSVKKINNRTGAIPVPVLIVVAIASIIGTGMLIRDDVHEFLDKVLIVIMLLIVLFHFECIVKCMNRVGRRFSELYKGFRNEVKDD